jgi:hypothetical protein
MTYFSLRKREHEPEPAEDFDDEAEEPDSEDEPTDEEQPAAPKGCLGALLVGVRGPSAWLTARFGASVSWAVHVLAVWAVGFYGGWVAVALVVAWLLAVAAFVPREQLERAASWVERRTTGRATVEAELEPGAEPVADPLVTVLWRLIADAPGVHVKTLAEHLQAAAPGEAVDRAAVRAKLAARSIPTRASVRDADGRVNEGVHRDDLKEWEEALPGLGDAPSPEVRSGPVATAVTCDVAAPPTPVATPLSRVRRLLSREGA